MIKKLAKIIDSKAHHSRQLGGGHWEVAAKLLLNCFIFHIFVLFNFQVVIFLFYFIITRLNLVWSRRFWRWRWVDHYLKRKQCFHYLSKLPNVFVQIAKCICSNCQMFLFKLPNLFVQIARYICPNWRMYFLKLQNVFVQIAKRICSNSKLYLFTLTNMYLFKFQNVFFQITKCICKCIIRKENNGSTIKITGGKNNSSKNV